MPHSTRAGDRVFPEITEPYQKKPHFLNQLPDRDPDYRKPDPENFLKFNRIVRETMKHDRDIADLLSRADKIINYCYEIKLRYKDPDILPDDLRHLLNTSTIDGILWILTRRNRPKIKPAPFIVIYNKNLIYDPDEKVIYLNKEGGISFPAPSNLTDKMIRWCIISEGVIEYYVRYEFCYLPDPAFLMVPDTDDD